MKTAALLLALAVSTPIVFQHAAAQEKGAMAGGMPSGMSHAMQSSPNAAKAPFDLQFIDTMVVHHQSAVEMAQLAEERAGHAELKQLASKMLEDQKKEIKQMQDWKQKWYPDKGDAINMKMPGMTESMKGMRMDKLASAKGDAFDRMFIDLMSRHHQGAVKMAQIALNKAQHAELKDLSKEIIREQKKEIAQLSDWIKEWKTGAK